MRKPILEPGRPGDLEMILETAWSHYQEVKRKNEPDQCWGIAAASFEALAMWLGLKPVAPEPPSEGQEKKP